MKRSKNQTSTTTSSPPSITAPYLPGAAGAANSLYTGGGTPVTPFSPQTEQALQMAQQRATAGSPVSGAAQDYATKTLNGGFMGSNPYLDQAFGKASGAVTNAVQSNFGLAGRNVRGPDAQGLATDKYNELAAQIYGGDYEQERARQQQLVPFSGGLANQDYADIGQLANVGAQREDLAREQAAQPSQNLDDYISRLGGIGGGYGVTNQMIPTQRNVIGGAASGAYLGGQMYPGNPWGAGIGGLIGGVFGG